MKVYEVSFMYILFCIHIQTDSAMITSNFQVKGINIMLQKYDIFYVTKYYVTSHTDPAVIKQWGITRKPIVNPKDICLQFQILLYPTILKCSRFLIGTTTCNWDFPLPTGKRILGFLGARK